MRVLHKLVRKTLKPLALQNKYPIPDLPSSAAYDELVCAAGRDRDYVALRHLLNKRISDGFFNTTNTFKFISTDLSVLEDLTEALSQIDEGFARKTAYDALIAHLSKLHRIDEALRVLDGMVRNRFGANAVTFHPILNALTKKKKMEEAWRVVDLMREIQIPIDLTGYNYLLTAYCHAGDLTSAAELLTKMEEEEGLRADTRTYDALVLGACRTGKVEGALAMLRRMEEDGAPLLYASHAHVIGAMLSVGYYEQAVEFVMSYGGRDEGLDEQSFGLLASRLINLKRFDEARFVVQEMKRRGIKMGDKLKEFYYSHVTV